MFSYKEVFSNPESYAFDEVACVKKIFEIYLQDYYPELDFMADIKVGQRAFRAAHGIKNYKKQIFLWNNGKLLQCYLEDGILRYKEFMYLHFQKKCPVPKEDITDSFYIFYDAFIAREGAGEDLNMVKKEFLYQTTLVKAIEKCIWMIKKMSDIITSEKKQRNINLYKRFVIMQDSISTKKR